MYKAIFSLVLIGLLNVELKAQTITEEVYEGLDHFVIKTKNATYYYDKSGGAFTRIIDKKGADWIGFKNQPTDTFPENTTSTLRGLPSLQNTDYRPGIGCTGSGEVVSTLVDPYTIISVSKNGKWQWRWSFNKNFATMRFDKIDPDQPYSFGYNGTPGGVFKPESQYWGTNLGGPRTEVYDMAAGDVLFANWQWAYFGLQDYKKVLFVAMQKSDLHIDILGYLGKDERGLKSEDGMLSFFFGRQGNDSMLLSDVTQEFHIGIINKKVNSGKSHLEIKEIVEGFIRQNMK